MARLSERAWSAIGFVSWAASIAIIVTGLFAYSKVQLDLGEAQQARQQAEFAKAELDSQLDAFDAASRNVIQYVEQNDEALKARANALTDLCKLLARSRDRVVITLCGNRELFTGSDDFVSFLIIQNEAVTLRGQGQFTESIESYGDALNELDEVKDTFTGLPDAYDLQRMSLFEGRAFAEFRTGNLEQARIELDRALDLEDTETRAVSGFVLSTDLKVRCEDGLGAEDASKLYDTYLERLSEARRTEEVRLDANPLMDDLSRRFWLQFRDEDLEYFKQDQELALLCGL